MNKKLITISATGVFHIDADELLKLNNVQDQLSAIEDFINKQSDTQSLTDQIKAIPWAPWVKWVAMDASGRWLNTEYEPRKLKDGWEANRGTQLFADNINLPTFPDWRESLIRVNDEREQQL